MGGGREGRVAVAVLFYKIEMISQEISVNLAEIGFT